MLLTALNKPQIVMLMLLTVGNKAIFLTLMFNTAENTYFVIKFTWKKLKNFDFHGVGRHSTTAKNVLDMTNRLLRPASLDLALEIQKNKDHDWESAPPSDSHISPLV